MTKYKTTKTDNNYYMLMRQSAPSIIFIFKSVGLAPMNSTIVGMLCYDYND